MNKNELLRNIQAISLVAVDLNLFLDTHPDDQKALQDYKNATTQYLALKNQYEQQYGPLLNFGHSDLTGNYNWINEPWPWKNK
jgi:spore coat protein JB